MSLPRRCWFVSLLLIGATAGCDRGAVPPPAQPRSGSAAPAVAPAPAPAPGMASAAPAAPSPAAPSPAQGASLAKSKAAIDQGLRWLRTQQAADGSYGGHPGLTAMVLQAWLLSPRKYREADGPFVRRGVEYLLTLAKPNGAIFDNSLPNYNTALAVSALRATDNPAYRRQIEQAQAFLVGLQASEATKHDAKDPAYGGIGYGAGERPDLDNLQTTLEALTTSGYAGDPLFAKRALRFVERCQNRSESNDQPWAGQDGGFVYTPALGKGGSTGERGVPGTASYGSMTYAGLLSLMYVDVNKDDPRVQDAVRWIKSHWDLTSHPGMGDRGLFFYYHTLAKALAAYGEPVIVDDQGRAHEWAGELTEALIARQDPEGWWLNTNPEYWEGNKILATARAVLALEAASGSYQPLVKAATAPTAPTPAVAPSTPAPQPAAPAPAPAR